MALPAVASWSNTADSGNTTSRAVGNPSGLTVGDLMVLHIAGGQFSANFTIPSGWTTLFHQTQTGGSSPRGNAMAYKVATSGDVSAGSVTVASDSSTLVLGLFRITGDYIIGGVTALRDTTNQTSVNIGHPAGLTAGDILLLITAGGSFGEVSDTPTGWSGAYQVIGSGSAPRSRMAAYKTAVAGDVSAGLTTITSGNDTYQRGLFVVSRVVDDEGTAEFDGYEPVFFVNASAQGSTGATDLLLVEPMFFAPQANVTQPTRWENPAKSSTSWINQDKT